jgi:hypothetical protein
MPDPTLDRAAALLRSGGRIAMTTAELAHALGQPSDAGTVATLERRLADDDRFHLFDTGAGLPGLEAWHPRDRLAYAAALRQVDLPRPPLVLLRDDRDPEDPAGLPDPPDPAGLSHPAGPAAGGPASTTSLGRLLWLTVLELAATRSAPSIALAAEEARAALLRVNPTPAGAAPSTTLPPGPRPPTRDRPVRPPRGPTMPRTPGFPPVPPTRRA